MYRRRRSRPMRARRRGYPVRRGRRSRTTRALRIGYRM